MIPLTCFIDAILIVVAIPAFFVVRIFEDQMRAKTNYYLSIRIEDVSISQVASHIEKVEAEYGRPCAWIEPQIQKAISEFPRGTLFFFNTPKKQWEALGGEVGYAIILNGKIVWKMRIARS